MYLQLFTFEKYVVVFVAYYSSNRTKMIYIELMNTDCHIDDAHLY